MGEKVDLGETGSEYDGVHCMKFPNNQLSWIKMSFLFGKKKKIQSFELGEVVHSCNPSTQKAEIRPPKFKDNLRHHKS